ncbi:MAG: hypothetical protein JKY54_08415, partial [Flavobacteriales bacterium]|nr:hypothetical protein [Flavobacteriales bacterium]
MKLRKASTVLLLGGLLLHTCTPKEGVKTTLPTQIEPLHLVSENGDTIQKGKPYPLDGHFISLDQVKMDSRQIVDSTTIEESQLTTYRTYRSKTIALGGNPKNISFGQGNYLPVTTVKIGAPLVYYIEPVITPALPFQNSIDQKLSYKSFGISQGLKSVFISSIFQDSRGYYWFGGRRGLTRYDGHSFYYHPFASDGQHRGVGAINEDAEGNIWMSFGSFGGLMKFDGNRFYEYKEGNGLELGEDYLGIIHADKSGNIWLKSETKVIKFDGEYFTCFPYQFQDLKNLNIIIKENDAGKFWLSALGGVCSLEGEKMKYYAIEERSENNICHPILEDERGLIVVTGKGISILKKDILQIFPSLFIENNDIRNTMVLGDDFILSSQRRKNGICSISDSTLTIVAENNPVFSGAIPLFVDHFEHIWLGTPGKGVIRYNPRGFKHFKFEEQHGGGHISALLEDRKGNIWFGSHGFGLYKYDGEKHTYYSLIEGHDEIAVRSLLEDDAGDIWVGTKDFGLFKIDISDTIETITRFHCFKSENYSVFALTEDVEHNIWVGTLTKGLLKFNGIGFTHYRLGETGDGQNSNNVRALITDRKGNVWVGSQYSGLSKFDGKQFTWYSQTEGLNSNHVVSLMEGSNGDLWIGTADAGVNRFDGEKFTSISILEGLTSNAIWTISEDHQQNIWLGADNCLNVLLRPTAESTSEEFGVKTYCDLEGLEGAEFYANSGIRDRKGRLWWGTDQMAVMLSNPEELVRQDSIQISIEELNIVNSKIDYRKLADSIQAGKTWIVDPDKNLDLATLSFEEVLPFVNCPISLQVPSALNDLNFVYAVKGIRNSNDVQFSFFMEGVDKTWSLPSKSNNANYRGLHAGTYTLKTKVSEGKGLWTAPHTYTFKVLPFWWETWWAYCLWALIALAVILGVYRTIHLRRVEKEATNRMKEIEAMKSQLYANITHEFRTPLTLIMGVTEQINAHENEKSIIRRNSQKLLYQINQLLDTAKLETGHLKLNLIQQDIIRYLKFLTESFYATAKNNGIQLVFYTEEPELVMDYDQEKIQEIVYNLLSNAIKFTPEKGEIIFHVSKEQGQVKLKVKDTGIGIAHDHVHQVFDRFYQVNNSNTKAGTGIGLALTKDLIQLMGGEINAKSELSKGTEFIILLPICNKSSLVTTFEFPKLHL